MCTRYNFLLSSYVCSKISADICLLKLKNILGLHVWSGRDFHSASYLILLIQRCYRFKFKTVKSVFIVMTVLPHTVYISMHHEEQRNTGVCKKFYYHYADLFLCIGCMSGDQCLCYMVYIYNHQKSIWTFYRVYEYMNIHIYACAKYKHNLSFCIFFLGRIWSISRWKIGRERQRNCDEIPHPRGREHLKSFMLLLCLVNIFSIVLH